MVTRSLLTWRSSPRTIAAISLRFYGAFAFTSSQYRLDSEYSGVNFFEGWDFYTGNDPTGGFVTYYSESSAQLTGLINATADGPAYMGVNSVDTLPFNSQTGLGDGAGRPSVRIASKNSWTHGLFVGDFAHIPAGICGTWPAFWTLGPNWPFTGEIDIMEGVNQNTNNLMSLHTNQTCLITGNSSTMTGALQNTNCAYYPDYNVGCGVEDVRTTSYGAGFNEAGGGVYAMQWTSDYIRIWQWVRSNIPEDLLNKQPDPANWGLPAAQLGVGNCSVDQHFQQHKIIFDNTFCGEYAGNPYVWNTTDANSCAASTNLATCDQFVADHPEAFRDAYWSVNSVRVYQLIDPEGVPATSTSYIASEQPTTTDSPSATTAVPTPSGTICPQYNFTVISDGYFQYEIGCGFDPPGPDIIGNPYAGFTANSLQDCIKGCTYMNLHNGSNTCGGVSHYEAINFCYFKKYIDGPPKYRPGYNEIRLIYYGYPQITDDPRSQEATNTVQFVETIPIPQTYSASTTGAMTTTSTTVSVFNTSTTYGTPIGIPGQGYSSTSTESAAPSDGFSIRTSQTPFSSLPNYNSTTSAPTAPYTFEPSSEVTATFTPPTASFTTDNNVSGVSSTTTSNDAATMTSSAGDSPSSSFYITFATGKSSSQRMLNKRSISYLSFNSSTALSILVDDVNEAPLFHLGVIQTLMVETAYVLLDTTLSPPQLRLVDNMPQNPVKIQYDPVTGEIAIENVTGYCTTSQGQLIAIIDDETTYSGDCLPVNPHVLFAQSNGTTADQSPSSDLSFAGSTTYTAYQPSSTDTALTTPTPLNGFIYSGCFGVPGPIPGVEQALTSAEMTVELCTSTCSLQAAYYAGMYNESCFCGTQQNVYQQLLLYPNSTCDLPCPGDSTEICGGNVGFQSETPKRQTALILVTLYNNTLLLPLQPGENEIPTSMSNSISETIQPLSSSSLTPSTQFVGSPLFSSSQFSEVSTISISTSQSTTTLTIHLTSLPTGSISYSYTATYTATVLTTVYVDVCNTCPGGLTTCTTTLKMPITAPQITNAATVETYPEPTIPMTETVKDCLCGEEGASSQVTVTIPCTDQIQSAMSYLPSQAALPGTASIAAPSSLANHAPVSTIPNDVPSMINDLPAAIAIPSANNVSNTQPYLGGNPNNAMTQAISPVLDTGSKPLAGFVAAQTSNAASLPSWMANSLLTPAASTGHASSIEPSNYNISGTGLVATYVSDAVQTFLRPVWYELMVLCQVLLGLYLL